MCARNLSLVAFLFLQRLVVDRCGDHVGNVASTRKRFGFDLVEASIIIEHRDRRTAAVRPQGAELPPADLPVKEGGPSAGNRASARVVESAAQRRISAGTYDPE